MSLKKFNMVTWQRLDAAVAPKAVRTEDELRELLTKAPQAWIDFSEPTTAEVGWLKSVFKFHQLSIDDCTDDLHYPKLEKFPHYLFVILHALDVPQGHDFRTTEVNFFISTKNLVTFHKRTLVTMTTVAQHLASKAFSLPLRSDALFQLLAGRLADEYFPLLDTLDEEIDAIEDSVFRAPERRSQSATAITSRFLTTKKRLSNLKRMLAPQREVFSRLTHGEFPEISAEATMYLRDVYDRLFRITELLDSFRDVLSSTLEAYLSVVSNRLNEVMKVLTIVTVILLPLSLIAGIYGMNFHFMPELYAPWGYPSALALMVIVAAGLVLYFRHRHWL